VPTQQQQQHAFVDVDNKYTSPQSSSSVHLGSEASLDSLLGPRDHHLMERGASEYQQSGLPSPYPSNFGDNHSEGSSADHASAAQQYPVKQEVNYPTSATPTSEYGVYPHSARSGSFAEHLQRPYHPASSASSGGMAQQQPNSPSMPQPDGRNHHTHAVKSDHDVPIDPSIAAPSPTYPYGQHSPYGPNPDMAHGYSHPSGGMYAQPRPDWGGYGQHGAPPISAGHPVYGQPQASAPPQQRPSQVSTVQESMARLEEFGKDCML
jgi:hypothetical protein